MKISYIGDRIEILINHRFLIIKNQMTMPSWTMNSLTLFSIMIHVMAYLDSVASQEMRITKTRKFTGFRLLPQYIDVDTTAPSMLKCLSQCIDTEGCVSAAWNPADNTCQLTDRLILSSRHEITEASSGWIVTSIWEFPVFNVKGPAGRYTIYSLSDAEHMCLSIDAVIADRQDLLTARAMGFNPCACGYMSDGFKGFVMQAPNLACWGSYSTEIVSCNSMSASNVWCKLTD